MSSKGIKRFALVCEPMYASYQEIIDFKLNANNKYATKKIVINKYSGIVSSSSGKHFMSEIDKFTSNFESEAEFLRKIEEFKPLHKFFIGYSSNGYISTLNPVFGNDELAKRILLTENDKLIDKKIIKEKKDLVNLLLNVREEFLNVYIKKKYFKTRTIETALREIRGIITAYKGVGLDSETLPIVEFRKEQLIDEFNKYHLYRGLFLAYQDYLKISEAKKIIEPEIAKNESEDVKRLILKPYEGEQLKF